MYKLIIFFQPPVNPESFQRKWQMLLGMLEALPGVQGEVITRFDQAVYGGVPFSMVHEVIFESRQALEEALQTTAGQAAGQFLQNITGGRVSIMVAEHQYAKAEEFKKKKGSPQLTIPPKANTGATNP